MLTDFYLFARSRVGKGDFENHLKCISKVGSVKFIFRKDSASVLILR